MCSDQRASNLNHLSECSLPAHLCTHAPLHCLRAPSNVMLRCRMAHSQVAASSLASGCTAQALPARLPLARHKQQARAKQHGYTCNQAACAPLTLHSPLPNDTCMLLAAYHCRSPQASPLPLSHHSRPHTPPPQYWPQAAVSLGPLCHECSRGGPNLAP